jgi:PEP-CTERM motif
LIFLLIFFEMTLEDFYIRFSGYLKPSTEDFSILASHWRISPIMKSPRVLFQTILAASLSGLCCQASILYMDVNFDVSPTSPTQPVTAFVFGNPTDVGGDTITNIAVNELTLAPGSAGDQITSLNFLLFAGNSVTDVRFLAYIWAPDGPGGGPGTLLGEFIYAPPYILGPVEQDMNINVTTPLIVPASGVIWAGAALDNDNGASSATNAQLENMGGETYDPASVGTDGLEAYYISPGTSLTNPSLDPFAAGNQGDFGWTITGNAVATPTPEPGTLGMMLLGVPMAAFVWRRRRNLNK